MKLSGGAKNDYTVRNPSHSLHAHLSCHGGGAEMKTPLLLLREVHADQWITCTNIKTEQRITGKVTSKDHEGIYLTNRYGNYYCKYSLFDYQEGDMR